VVDVKAQVRADLTRNDSEEPRRDGLRYFKEKVNPHGVGAAAVSRISESGVKALRDKGMRETLGPCDRLWASGYLEESFIACHWVDAPHDRYEEGDLARFERWRSLSVTTWASCD
jgi:hypothetical protein